MKPAGNAASARGLSRCAWRPTAMKPERRINAPLWCCGFRPFYLATALYAVLALALWGPFFVRGWPLPPEMGGALAWHAQ